jgi:CzcA family heavy metal efflux pump
MLNKVIIFALKNRLLVIAMAALITVLGGKTILQMPIDVFPDLNKPTVTIMTEIEGFAPEEVETLVTRPIEMSMAGLAGVSRVRSTSGIGLSIVYVEFEWGSSLLIDRQLVSEKLTVLRDNLPPSVTPAIGPITSIMGEIMLVGLTSQSVAPMDLRTLADWTVRPRLHSIPGVAQVISIGGGIKQYQIDVSPTKLKDFSLSLEDVFSAAKSVGRNTTGGYVEDAHQEYLIRNIGKTQGAAEIAKTAVTVKGGVPVTLGQLGTVKVGIQNKRGDASINGMPGVILSIQKQPGANTVSLTRDIEAALKQLEVNIPKDVKIYELFKQASFIETAVQNVEESLRDGAILVAIILFLFLLNFRTTIITLTAIPLSFVVTALILHAFEISINTMTLGGLAVAIGELVDDAIVDVENVFRRLREARSQGMKMSPLNVIFLASSEVRNSIVIATLIVILVFIPLFAMGGIEGRLFVPLGIAYVVSILASLLVSLTVTPVLCSYLLPLAKATAHDSDGAFVRWLKRIDLKLLNTSLIHPKFIVVASAAGVVAAMVGVAFMGREFLPPFNEGTATISLMAFPGTSLTESNRLGTIAERQIMKVPEVVSVGRRTGRAEQDEHAEGVHSSEVDVDLKPSTRSRQTILADIRDRLNELPGIMVNIGQPISHRLDHLLSGVRAQIAIKIFGPNLARLRALAGEVNDALKGVPGLVDRQVERTVLIPQVQVIPDPDKVGLYGLSAGGLTEWLEASFLGRIAGQILEGDRTVNVLVRMDPSYRSEPKMMEQLLVDTPVNVKMPLKTLATVQVSQGPNQVSRENGQRRIVVAANTEGRDLGSVVEDIQRIIKTQVALPEGYFIELGGQFESQVSATKTIAALSVISILAIVLVLYGHFGSWILALQIMLNLPLAVIGSVIAVYLSGGTFSVATLVGFVTLCGIASRNGIMMISHYLHLMAHEGESFTKEMVVRGSIERLVPVLMTALTAALALIPLVMAAGEPGKEILHPVAVVILGGLISSTILDMAVTPTVFFAFGRGAAEKAILKMKLNETKEMENVQNVVF